MKQIFPLSPAPAKLAVPVILSTLFCTSAALAQPALRPIPQGLPAVPSTSLRSNSTSPQSAPSAFPSTSPTAANVQTTTQASAAQNQLAPQGASVSELPPVLLQVARFTNALEVMRNIEKIQGELNSGNPSIGDPMALLAKRQKLVYLREKLNIIIETSNLEVNATRSQIEALMAQVQQQQATMVEKRARALRRNTIINFVSGGITKIVGYSIALAGPDQPTNILEIFDGGVQCALSTTVMKDLHAEGHMVKEMPALLLVLFKDDDKDGLYARQVWNYLNETPSGGPGPSRRAELTTAWRQRGILDRHEKGAKLKETGGLPRNLTLAQITPQLLDDRLAMLSEVRSTVSEMHLSLMELSQRIKKSYEKDPSFDWPIAAEPNTTM